jgi:hypothetical protein
MSSPPTLASTGGRERVVVVHLEDHAVRDAREGAPQEPTGRDEGGRGTAILVCQYFAAFHRRSIYTNQRPR